MGGFEVPWCSSYLSGNVYRIMGGFEEIWAVWAGHTTVYRLMGGFEVTTMFGYNF